jgi:hypothetical protein
LRTVRAVRFRVFALRRRALGSLLLALERRRIAHPKAQDYANFQVSLQQGFATGEMGFKGQFAPQKSGVADVCFGSEADIGVGLRHVRFTPKSGHSIGADECPLCANSRKRRDHSITSSARAESPGGTFTPSFLAVLRLITNSNLVA